VVSRSGTKALSARALGQYGKPPEAAYRLGMDSGPAVSQADAATVTVVKGTPGEKLAETQARCQAVIAAAEASVLHAQAALSAAKARLRRAQEVERNFRERRARASRVPSA
jgi:hypothetical protein